LQLLFGRKYGIPNTQRIVIMVHIWYGPLPSYQFLVCLWRWR